MADEPRSGIDAVEGGPVPSDPGEDASSGGDEAPAPTRDDVRSLEERFPDAVVSREVTLSGQHVVYVAPERSVEVLAWLKEEPAQHYDLLADLTAVDYGGGRPIQVVYQLWSIPHRRGLRVKCELPLSDLEIASVCELWATANWLEREVYDMFGVEFHGHPDLRRILMPENYAEGHPLRKDFPLRGRFSRAEQTRRALSQDPRDHYVPAELEMGGVPETAEGAPEGRPDLPSTEQASSGEEDDG